MSRRAMGPTFHPGEILEVRGVSVLVGFDDGSSNEWTKIAALRVIRTKAGDGAEPVKINSPRLSLDSIRAGDRVWAPWLAGGYFVGTVDRIQGDEAHIHFDDGDQGWVRLDQITPCEIVVGLRILGRWKMGNQYFPGVIDKVVAEKIHIVYDDGDKEWTTSALSHCRASRSVHPSAQPGTHRAVTRCAVS